LSFNIPPIITFPVGIPLQKDQVSLTDKFPGNDKVKSKLLSAGIFTSYSDWLLMEETELSRHSFPPFLKGDLRGIFQSNPLNLP
jgi:hypothetical protein